MSSSTPPVLSTFTLPDTTPTIPVTHPQSIITQDQILAFPAFKAWLSTLQKSLSLQTTRPRHPFKDHPYALRSIEIQSADFFSSHRLGFLKLRATITNDQDEHLPGSVFMRGGSVAMLIILQPTPTTTTISSDDDDDDAAAPTRRSTDEAEEYVILTVQPRIAAGSLSFTELPAGMIDDSGTFAGAAAKEITEETGLEISTGDLLDMTQLAIDTGTATSSMQQDQDQDGDTDQHLQKAMYPSPGASDEFIPVFLARRSMARDEIESLRGKLTGLRDHGEKITLNVVPVSDVWKVAARDAKTLAAMALYQGLKADGRI